MTLVVARKVSETILIVGDTKLTFEMTKEKISVTEGVIKSKIISDAISVSFANNEYLADAAIRSIAGNTNPDAVVRALLQAQLSVEDKHAPDFIVATMQPTIDLFVIRGGKIERALNAWIGSAEAFQLFRAYETENRKPPHLPINSASITGEQLAGVFGEVSDCIDVYTRMLRSIKCAIDDESVEDIGGFAIPLVGSNGAFAYFGYADVWTHWLPIKEGNNIVPFGTAEEGGYAYDIVANGDNRGLSSYFLQGRFGILYREVGGGLLRPHLISDVSPIEFEERASQIVGSVVRTWYADNRLLCQRALDKFASGDHEGAWIDANRAIERGSTQSDAWKCRGAILSKMGKENQALLDFERATKVSPQDPDAWNKLGLSRSRLGDTEGALRAFSVAIDRDPAFWPALANRATSYWEGDQTENALRDITGALAHQPTSAGLWKSKAAAHLRLGMRQDALTSVEKALQLAPNDPELLKAESELRLQLNARPFAT